MREPSLFDAPMHRALDPDTSREAGDRVREKLSTLQQQVLTAVAGFGRRGVTAREVERLPVFDNLAPSTVRKRLSELLDAQKLIDIGRRDGMTIYAYPLGKPHP